MRTNFGALVIVFFACIVLALPVAAQENVRGDLGGISQWLAWLIESWLGESIGDETELAPHIPPGGQPLADNPETGPLFMPGGLSAPGDSPEVTPYSPIGGSPASGESPEVGPYFMPGG